MSEAVKQFFVGFLHPRTWIAAIIALVFAALAGLALSGTLIDTIGSLLALPPSTINDLKNIAIGVFLSIFFVISALTSGSAVPLIMVIVSGVIAGLIFGLVSKKERVASKSIIGGLNIAVIYLVIAIVVFAIWAVGLGSGLWPEIYLILTSVPLDIAATFFLVWWVSAIVSMIVLSAKH
jgi:hypothetical protein